MGNTTPHGSTLSDSEAMDRAVALASLSPAHGPNPRVGAVLVGSKGIVLGEGYHKGAGTPHAEVAAIADAAARGASLHGATAFVTLEPCNHTGRTGPCTEALLNAGISRVLYAVPDPNPHASGGAQTLANARVMTAHAPHAGALALNERWLRAMREQRPYVIAKWAQTLDGYTAAADGSSFWITGESARDHVHHVRATVDAIVVGTGTVLADDPLLSARPGGVEQGHQPLRVVVGLRTTEGKAVWRDANAIRVPSHEPAAILDELWSREVRTVIVEGGATVVSAFIASGLVDELNVYIAPALLGAGIRAVAGLGIETMSHALRAERAESLSLGVDTLVRARMWKED